VLLSSFDSNVMMSGNLTVSDYSFSLPFLEEKFLCVNHREILVIVRDYLFFLSVE
jgi:hypothetical protein